MGPPHDDGRSSRSSRPARKPPHPIKIIDEKEPRKDELKGRGVKEKGKEKEEENEEEQTGVKRKGKRGNLNGKRDSNESSRTDDSLPQIITPKLIDIPHDLMDDPTLFASHLSDFHLEINDQTEKELRRVLTDLAMDREDEKSYNDHLVGVLRRTIEPRDDSKGSFRIFIETDKDLGSFHAKGRPVYSGTEVQEIVREIRKKSGDLFTRSEPGLTSGTMKMDQGGILGSDPSILNPISILSPPGSIATSTTSTGSTNPDGIRKPDFASAGCNGSLCVVGQSGEHKTCESDGEASEKITRQGWAQSMIQLVSCDQAFGTHLGYVMINTMFSRMVMIKEKIIAIEISERDDLKSIAGELFTASQFFQSTASLHRFLRHSLGEAVRERKRTTNHVGVQAFWHMFSIGLSQVMLSKWQVCQPLKRPEEWGERLNKLTRLNLWEGEETLTGEVRAKVRRWVKEDKPEHKRKYRVEKGGGGGGGGGDDGGRREKDRRDAQDGGGRDDSEFAREKPRGDQTEAEAEAKHQQPQQQRDVGSSSNLAGLLIRRSEGCEEEGRGIRPVRGASDVNGQESGRNHANDDEGETTEEASPFSDSRFDTKPELELDAESSSPLTHHLLSKDIFSPSYTDTNAGRVSPSESSTPSATEDEDEDEEIDLIRVLDSVGIKILPISSEDMDDLLNYASEEIAFRARASADARASEVKSASPNANGDPNASTVKSPGDLVEMMRV